MIGDGEVQITKIGDVYIVQKKKGSDFFNTTYDSFAMTTFNFSSMLKFMIFSGLLSPKVLEGILSEWYK